MTKNHALCGAGRGRPWNRKGKLGKNYGNLNKTWMLVDNNG